MPQFRLVLHPQHRTWGSHGLEWYERYYLLQRKDDPPPGLAEPHKHPEESWHTIPCVLYQDLTQQEKDEIAKALGVEGWRIPP